MSNIKTKTNRKDYFTEVCNNGSKDEIKKNGTEEGSFYRIVVSDSRSPRDGRFIEEVGYYDSTKDPSVIKFDEEATKKWLANGAQPTETVGKLLKIAGIQ